MAKDESMSEPASGAGETKLQRIPQGARIHKRPLTRRQPPSSSKQPIIYVSSRSPFMSIIHRTRKILNKSLRNTTAAPKNATLQSRIQALERITTSRNSSSSSSSSSENKPVVKIMATGRAIDKAVHVAAWFQQQGDCVVEIRTRSMATVDDVVVDEQQQQQEEEEDCFGAEDESRLRNLSVLELGISLK